MPKWQKLQKQLKAQKDASGPKSMKRMMKKMGRQGMNMEEINDVEKVVIYASGNKIIIDHPQNVVKMLLPQGEVYQIMGATTQEEVENEEVETIESEEIEDVETIEKTAGYKPVMGDIQLVAQQAGVSPEEAENALIETKGNLAKAIILLRQQ